MLFDTHAHYYAEAFDPDRDAVLSALPAAGVGLVLCPGCDLDTSASPSAGGGPTPMSTPPPGSTRRTPWGCRWTGWTRWRR